MLHVIAEGEDQYRLEDVTGALVGWIRGQAIGFRGFRNERDAMTATMTASGALDGALRRRYGGSVRRSPAREPLHLVHDGAHEWVSDGTLPLARLLRPAADRVGGAFALELVLPSYVGAGDVIAIAQVVGRAVLPHLDAVAIRPAAAPTVHRPTPATAGHPPAPDPTVAAA